MAGSREPAVELSDEAGVTLPQAAAALFPLSALDLHPPRSDGKSAHGHQQIESNDPAGSDYKIRLRAVRSKKAKAARPAHRRRVLVSGDGGVGPMLRRPTLRLSHYSFAVKERSGPGDLLGGGGGERSLCFLVASEPCLVPANWLTCAFGRAAHGTRGFGLCRRIWLKPEPHTTDAAKGG